MEKFQIGDVVRLKSGGDSMTINADNGDDTYNCVWQKNGEHKAANYSEAILAKYTPSFYASSNPKRNNHF